MNREELEKMFDEKINTLGYNAERYIEHNEKLKRIFFDTIIPEVLKSVLPEREKLKLGSKNQDEYVAYSNGYNNCIKNIKQKAKELYNINL